MAKIILGLMIAAIVAVGGLVMLGSRDVRAPATTKVALSAAQARGLALAIVGGGMNCPAAKLAYDLGETTQGHALKVYCGPDDGGDGVSPALVYRVVVDGPNAGAAAAAN